MTADKMDFMNSPAEKLQTWDKIWKMMLISAGVTLVVLALLGLFFA